MSFGLFDFSSDLDTTVLKDPSNIETLRKLRNKVGNNALPNFLIEYISTVSRGSTDALAIHVASSIVGSKDADQAKISRDKGLMGQSQLEPKRFPRAVHHIKIFHNGAGKARVFYKFKGNVQFVQNLQRTD